MVRDKNSGEVYFEHSVNEGDLWRSKCLYRFKLPV